MATLYNLEPQPTAKAILHTTSGDILLEIFAQQTPKTSRNFLQLCLDGYYDNTIFHRLVSGFIIQAGDPTGTGEGGESSFEGGKPFEDEFHNRLKFNRRGLLGMANGGSKNDNGSQFFLTLDKADELNNKHTMFGRIEGNTIFNLVKMGEAELNEGEGNERPLFPTMIKSTEVLVNPFEDMVKQARVAPRAAEEKPQPKKKSKKKAGKQMLSFGGEEGDENTVAPVQVPKFNTKLVQSSTIDAAATPTKPELREKPRAPSTLAAPNGKETIKQPVSKSAPAPAPTDPTPSPTPSPEPEDRQAAILARTNAQIEDLKKSLKRSAPESTRQEPVHKKKAIDSLVPEGAVRGFKRRTKDEQRALDDFKAFQARLDAARGSATSITKNGVAVNADKNGTNGATADEDEEEEVCDLHFVPNCQSCKKWDAADADAEDGDAPEGLMGHSLSFAKDRAGKNLEWKRQNEKELVVIDPREREKEFVKSKGKGKRRG